MGARHATRWRLSSADRRPRVVVASTRALMQRPTRNEPLAPVVVRTGDVVGRDDLLATLAAHGYRREHRVEHRGEVAVRGGIVDVWGSTADAPVRIDLYGDEVERLCTFDPGDQRQADACDEVWLFSCRELVLDDADRERAGRLESTEPWGASHFSRLADGELFDGMEGWLTWLEPGEPLTSALTELDVLVVVDPARAADRAAELLDEEAALLEVLSRNWGAPEAPAPLHVDLDAVLACAPRAVVRLVSVPEDPSTPVSMVRPAPPLHGDPARLAAVVSTLPTGTTAVVCAQTDAAAAHLAGQLAREGVSAVVTDAVVPGTVCVVVVTLSAGCAAELAGFIVWADADVTGRRTVHRPPRPRSRAVEGFFDDLAVGSFVVHRHHGVARFGGVTTREIAGTSRDYLILEFRGTDRLYLPTDQIEAITGYSGGETPTLSKMGGADWHRTTARAKAAAGEIAAGARRAVPRARRDLGPRLRARHALAARDRGAVPVHRDRRPAPRDRRREGGHGGATRRWTASCAPTSASARPRSRSVRCSSACRTPSRPPCSCRPRCSRASTSRRSRSASRATRCASRCSAASSPTPRPRAVVDGVADGAVDVVIGTHRLLAERRRVQGPRAPRRRRGAALRRHAQRGGEEARDRGRRAHAHREPHPADLGDGAHRHPRPVDDPDAAARPPADPHLRRRVRRARRHRGDPPRAAARGPGVLRAQPRARHRGRRAPASASSCPRPASSVAHGQMDEGTLERVVLRLLGAAQRRARVHDDHRVGHRHADGQHARRRPRGPARARPAPPAPRPRRAERPARLRVPVPPAATGCSPSRPTSACGRSASTPSSGQRLQDRDARPRDPRRGQPARRATSPATSPRSATTCTSSWSPRRSARRQGVVRPDLPTVSLDVPGDAHLPASYVTAEDDRLEAYRRLAQVTTTPRAPRRRGRVARPVRAAARSRADPPRPRRAARRVPSLRGARDPGAARAPGLRREAKARLTPARAALLGAGPAATAAR